DETFPSTRTGKIERYALQEQRWGYRHLADSVERAIYRTLQEAVQGRSLTATMDPAGTDLVFNVFLTLINDYPEYFWLSPRLDFTTRSVNGSAVDMDIRFTHTVGPQELKEREEQVARVLEKILDEVGDITDPYEQVKRVYEYLITETKYRSRVTDQSMYSVLVEGRGVCAGYARAFQFIMRNLGFESIIVTGDLKQNGREGGVLSLFTPYISEELDGHAWNMVKIGTQWYHVDVTSGEALTTMNRNISYNFLTIPTEQILKTHLLSAGQMIPHSDSYDLEYYRTHGLYLERFDLRAYQDLFSIAEEKKERDLDVRFASTEALQNAVDNLIGRQKIFQFLNDDEIRYFIDDVNMILTVEVP
ncbi:MAG: transglutaminase domain-containing protein, partial [Sphaerochaetaceae bacterium]|nr:transglutaminase domain-containing protein [Sphaerochaetaceae bacterium]